MTGRRATLVGAAALLLAAGCAAQAPPEVLARPPGPARVVALPSPDLVGTTPLETVIAGRRSMREFSARPLSLGQLGQLLWAGQGITDAAGHRAAPSAGALYPLELYVVTPDRLLHYLPEGHRVEVRRQRDVREELRAAALDQAVVGASPDLLVVAAVPERTAKKYGGLATGFVDREAGHATENILLQATALGLSAVSVGGFNPVLVEQVLGLPPEEHVLYLVPVGHPPP